MLAVGRADHDRAPAVGGLADGDVQRQFAEEVGERVRRVPRHPVVLLELGAGPADRLLGTHVEAIRVEERTLVVVAQQHHAAAITDEFHALAGIRPVADHIAEAVDGVNLLPVDILQDRAERLHIAVDVADDGPFHWNQTRSAGP